MTGQTEQLTATDWSALHERLGEDPAEAREAIEPLRLARNAVGHGNPDHRDLLPARINRETILIDVRRRALRALASAPDIELDEIQAALPPDDPWAVDGQ